MDHHPSLRKKSVMSEHLDWILRFFTVLDLLILTILLLILLLKAEIIKNNLQHLTQITDTHYQTITSAKEDF
jgi:hypothetical protein